MLDIYIYITVYYTGLYKNTMVSEINIYKILCYIYTILIDTSGIQLVNYFRADNMESAGNGCEKSTVDIFNLSINNVSN